MRGEVSSVIKKSILENHRNINFYIEKFNLKRINKNLPEIQKDNIVSYISGKFKTIDKFINFTNSCKVPAKVKWPSDERHLNNVINKFNNLRIKYNRKPLEKEIIKQIIIYDYNESFNRFKKDFLNIENRYIERQKRKNNILNDLKNEFSNEIDENIIDNLIDENIIDLSGYVYIINDPRHNEWIKIGYTTNLEKRLKAYQTYTPYGNINYLFSKKFSNARYIELYIHKKYSKFRGNGEWFNLNHNEVIKFISYL